MNCINVKRQETGSLAQGAKEGAGFIKKKGVWTHLQWDTPEGQQLFAAWLGRPHFNTKRVWKHDLREEGNCVIMKCLFF